MIAILLYVLLKQNSGDRSRELKQQFLLGLNESLQVEVRRWVNLKSGLDKLTLDDLLERARCEEGFKKPATKGKEAPTFEDDNSVMSNQKPPNFRNNRSNRGRTPGQDWQPNQVQLTGTPISRELFQLWSSRTCGSPMSSAAILSLHCGGRGHTNAVCPSKPASHLN